MSLPRRPVRLVAAIGALGLLLAVALLGFTEFQRTRAVTLPGPTGPYAVGRVTHEWTDDARRETLAPADGGARELVVWVWYPAAPTSAAPAPYLPEAWARARERDWGLAAPLAQSPAAIRAHAVAGAPVATDRPSYPVLLLLPGLGPLAADYTTLAEELASDGYVVVSPTPTYSASVVAFADGRVARATAAGTLPDREMTVEESQRLGDALLAVWVADTHFLIDRLDRLNGDPGDPLAGRLDLGRLGVAGHSFGGATAAETCRLDRRCRAGANVDGYPFGEVDRLGLDQPFLFIWSEQQGSCDAQCQQAARDTEAIYSRLPQGGYQVTIRGARHFNFTDFAVQYWPVLRATGALGPIDGRRGLRITADYLRAFFDRYLRDLDSPLLHPGPSPYPEVDFQAR